MKIYKIKIGRKIILAYTDEKPTIEVIKEPKIRGERIDTLVVDEMVKIDWSKIIKG